MIHIDLGSQIRKDPVGFAAIAVTYLNELYDGGLILKF